MRRDTKDRLIVTAVAVLAMLILLIPLYFTTFRTHSFRWMLWRELP